MPVSISPGQRAFTLTSVRWSCHAAVCAIEFTLREVRLTNVSDGTNRGAYVRTLPCLRCLENLINTQKAEEVSHAEVLQSTGPPPARIPATATASLSTLCIPGD
jgi:deoxycytidylate deaminase